MTTSYQISGVIKITSHIIIRDSQFAANRATAIENFLWDPYKNPTRTWRQHSNNGNSSENFINYVFFNGEKAFQIVKKRNL